MSFYRNVDVNGKEFQYHIGRDFVKIKGFKKNGVNTFQKSEIFSIRPDIIKPGMIRNFILGIENKPEDFFHTCKCKNVKKHLTVIPFDAEICEKYHHIYWCDDCLNDNAENI